MTSFRAAILAMGRSLLMQSPTRPSARGVDRGRIREGLGRARARLAGRQPEPFPPPDLPTRPDPDGAPSSLKQQVEAGSTLPRPTTRRCPACPSATEVQGDAPPDSTMDFSFEVQAERKGITGPTSDGLHIRAYRSQRGVNY